MRLIYYSLANFPDDSREQQWMQSIRSLRLYNRSIPVWLLLFNGASDALLREADRWRVHVHSLGDYAGFLQRTHPHGSVLALYPTFHKFLALAEAPLPSLTQLLYLDCDTFFFDDANQLFDRYSTHDWYAREEPMTLRSQYVYDPNHVDEALLGQIAVSEGLRSIAPFNSGVCLMNHGVWRNMSALRDPYLDLVWRLLCGIQLRPDLAEEQNPAIRQAVIDVMTEIDRLRALPYPSANTWIIEQIALWLALGSLNNFSLGTLAAEQVPQGHEFEPILSGGRRCILAHYYSVMEKRFFSTVPPIGA